MKNNIDKKILSKAIEYISTNENIEANDIIIQCIYSDDREVYRLATPQNNYIYKTTGSASKSLDEFKIEFDLIKTIWDESGGNLNIPEPFFLNGSDGFLMSECRGIELKKLYFESIFKFWKRKDILLHINNSAKWLANFHQISSSIQDYNQYLGVRRNNLQRMASVIRSKCKHKNALEVFDKIEPLFELKSSLSKVPIGRLHGNFALRNIIADTQSVSLIDFEDSRIDCIFYDVAMFVVELLNKNLFQVNKKFNSDLIDVFLKQYNEEVSIDAEILHSYLLYHSVWSFYEIVNRSKPTSFLKKIILNYRLLHAVNVMKVCLKSDFILKNGITA